MKVFRIVAEYIKEDSTEVITEEQFVTQEDNCIEAVTAYMNRECEALGKELKSVADALVIADHIKSEHIKGCEE